MNDLVLIAPYNGINHFATVLSCCKKLFPDTTVTMIVEINRSINELEASKNDCQMLSALCMGKRLVIKFADDPSCVFDSKIVSASILNIPHQSRANFPYFWDLMFLGSNRKIIVGDNIGIPVINRNPVLNIFLVYLEFLKNSLGFSNREYEYSFVRELCPPIFACFQMRLGTLSNIVKLLKAFYAAKRREILEENQLSINRIVTEESILKCGKYQKVIFLLLTNNIVYNKRMLNAILRSSFYETYFIYVIPHPKAECAIASSEKIQLVNSRGICAEILISLIAQAIGLKDPNILVMGSSSALLLFAQENMYSYRIIKEHLRPLTNSSDLIRYIRLLGFQSLCRKVCP